VLMGSFVFFMEPTAGTPRWVGDGAGALFILAGLGLLAWRLPDKLYSRILFGASMLVFLAIFHWVSFGAGERIGTATTPFSQHRGANVKTFFAVFTALVDLALLAAGVRWLVKGRSK
jgi:hypothetical protein